MEETTTRHKKELKALEGEKRAAIKKAKGLKGKKGKEALARYVNTDESIYVNVTANNET